MNYLLEKIKIELNKFFLDYELEINLDFKITKFEKYDLQINNLVQFNSRSDFETICKKVKEILESYTIFKKIEITDNGFINLSFDTEELFKSIKNTRDEFKTLNPEKIVIDYGGPNIGKPLHVGHIRTLNIGRSIYNLQSFISNDIKSDIHLGDWGMPVAQIITYIDENNLEINELTSDDYQIIYPKASTEYKLNEEFKNKAQSINKLLNENDEIVINKWKIIKNTSLEKLKKDLEVFNHDFDFWLGESDVNNMIPDMIKDLTSKKLVTKDDGALVSSETTDPKILITKSDGSYLYITTDLATVIYRKKHIPYDKALYVVDKRQSLHFQQLFSCINYFNLTDSVHEHIAYGTLNDSKGNPFKTREGDSKPLLELFEEIKSYIYEFNNTLSDTTLNKLTNSVLTYSDLLTNRKTDYKFDLEKFASNSGKTGIYVQYSQVRAKKLLEKFKFSEKRDFRPLKESEKNLMRIMSVFGIFLEQSIKTSEPHHLANYLYDISNSFNIFYEDEKFSDLNSPASLNTKLYLTELFLTTISNTMYCLGIEPVDEM